MKRIHAVFASAVVAGFALGAVIEHSNDPALAKTIFNSMVETFKSPFDLFAGRSPGERGDGALLSTKSGRQGPHERVLSEVRDRQPAGDAPPAAGGAPSDVNLDALGAQPLSILPGAAAAGPISQYPSANTLPFMAFPSGAPATAPTLGTAPAGIQTGSVPDQLIDSLVEAPPTGLREIGFPTTVSVKEPLPEALIPIITVPPGSVTSGPPTVTAIPEPGGFGVMILGLLAIIFATMLRRTARRSDLVGVT